MEVLEQIAGGNEVALQGLAAVIILVVYKAFQLAAKLIPDSATGFLGSVRKVAKIASGYVKNRE